MSNKRGMISNSDIRLEGCVLPRPQIFEDRESIRGISLMPLHRIESEENGERYDERHN